MPLLVTRIAACLAAATALGLWLWLRQVHTDNPEIVVFMLAAWWAAAVALCLASAWLPDRWRGMPALVVIALGWALLIVPPLIFGVLYLEWRVG